MILKLFLGSLILSTSLYAQDKIPVSASIRQFSGGLNDTIAPHYLSDGQSPKMLNVVIDDPVGVVRQRDGYTSCGVTPSGQLATRLYEYRKSTGERNLIVTDNNYFWQTKDCSAWTQIIQATNTIRPDFTTYKDKLWVTYQSSNVFTWNGTVATILNGSNGTSNPPKGKYITTWNDRIWIANTADQPSAVYFSSLADFTETIAGAELYDPAVSTGAFPAINAFYINREDGAVITGIKEFRGKLFVFKNTGIWYISFDNETNNAISKGFSNIGCNYGSSVVEVDNVLVFLGSDGFFYKTDGTSVVRIGDSIETLSASIKQPVGNNIQISWSDSWNGTISPSLSIDTITYSGEFRLSTHTATQEYLQNPSFRGDTSPWTYSGLWSYNYGSLYGTATGLTIAKSPGAQFTFTVSSGATQVYSQTTTFDHNGDNVFTISSAAIAAGYLATIGTAITEDSTVTYSMNIAVQKMNAYPFTQVAKWKNSNLYFNLGCISESLTDLGDYWYIGRLHAYVYFLGNVGGSTYTTDKVYDLGMESSAKDISVYLVDQYFVDSITPPTTISTQTFTIKNSTMATMVPSTDIALSTTPVWDSAKWAYKFVISLSSITGRYLQIGHASKAISRVELNIVSSSGTFTNSVYDFTGLSNWGGFVADYLDNGGTTSFEYRTSTDTAMTTPSAWTAIKSGSVVGASTTTPFFQWRATLSSTDPDYLPVVYGITQEVSSGSYTANAVSAIYFKGRYIVAVTTGTDQKNNLVLVKSKFNDAWMPFDWHIADFAQYGNYLYGALTSTNSIVSLFSGNLDGSDTITSYWESKDYMFDSPMFPKYMQYIYSDYKIGVNQSLDIGYSVDEGTTWNNFTMNATVGSGTRGGKWINIAPYPNSLYRFRVYNNTNNTGFTLYGLDAIGYATKTRSDR